MRLLTAFAIAALVPFVAACDEAVSTLQDIETTAAEARATATEITTRTDQIQQAVDDPVGAMRGLVTANLSRLPTDQPGLYVLTDLQSGRQFLATYAADGTTVSSIAPRVEAVAGGAARQRCIALPGGERAAVEEG